MNSTHSAKKVNSSPYSYSFPLLPKELLKYRLEILRLIFSELRPHLLETVRRNGNYISEVNILLPVVAKVSEKILPGDTNITHDQILDMVIQMGRRYAIRMRCAV